MKNKSQHLIDSVIPSVTSSSNDLSIMALSPNATGGGDLNQLLQAQSIGLENWFVYETNAVFHVLTLYARIIYKAGRNFYGETILC